MSNIRQDPGSPARLPESVPSPITGWTRQTWADLADDLLLTARRYGSPGNARLRLPGPLSSAGRDSDELEGFARTFLLAGFRVIGERGEDPQRLIEWYSRGLRHGTDPSSPEAWPSLRGPVTNVQARVEAASIALVLSLCRESIWEELDSETRQQIIAWLSPAVGARFPEHNWLWFQVVIETFLRSVGVPTSRTDLKQALERHEHLSRAGGWYADGDGRAFDHYNGWAFHFYPLMWTMIEPDRELAEAYRPRYERRLRAYLNDAIHLVGADGSPLIQGRSLVYRFAAAAPFWMGAITRATDQPLGALRRAASGILSHFAAHGAPDDAGLLTIGWHGEWLGMAQTYSGFGSPYWASKGLLGLMLPADHPAWTATEQPLPIERGDFTRALPAPGWAVSGTRADGIVRVVNHGTDLGTEPPGVTLEHPLYTRFGYSTATFPPPIGEDAGSLISQSVTQIDEHGRGRPRTGFQERGVAHDGLVAAAYSRDSSDDDRRDGPPVASSVCSVVRGPWEVRVIDVQQHGGAGGASVRIGGWPLAADTELAVHIEADHVHVHAETGIHSTVRILLTGDGHARSGVAVPRVHREQAVSPLGQNVAIPWVRWRLPDDRSIPAPLVVAIGLGGDDVEPPTARVCGDRAIIRWGDGRETTLSRRDDAAPALREWVLADTPIDATGTVSTPAVTTVVAVADDIRARLLRDEDLAELRSLGARLTVLGDGDLTSERAISALSDAEIIVTSWGTRCDPDILLAHAPRLRLIAHAAGSVKPIVNGALLSRGVLVSSQADVNALPVAEYSAAAILLAAKGAHPVSDATHAYEGVPGASTLSPRYGAFQTRVGIVGASRIGRRVIDTLRRHELDICVYDPFLPADEAVTLGVSLLSLPELFRTSRVVSLHAPLLDSTRRLITAELIAAMPDGATLINTARAQLVDEGALTAELSTGRIGAVLDVVEQDLLSAGSPLSTMPNVLVTPHIAGTAGNEYRRIGRGVTEEISRFLRGRRLVSPVTLRDLERMA